MEYEKPTIKSYQLETENIDDFYPHGFIEIKGKKCFCIANVDEEKITIGLYH